MLLQNKRFEKKIKPYILVIPLFAYLSLIVFGGIGFGLMQSLGYFKAIGMTEISFKYFLKVFHTPAFLENLKFSLYTSIVSSFIAVIIGVIISFCLLNYNNNGKKIVQLFKVPLTVPHIVVVLMIITMFTKTGFFARVLNWIFPFYNFSFFSKILYDKNGIGIILVYLWKEIPFVALTVHSILVNLDKSLGLAAKNLGANTFQTIIFVLLPLAMPTIFSSFIIILAFSFGAYEVPWLIGPTVPKALPVQAFIEYTNPMFENRSYAMAYNMIILGVAFLMILFFWLCYRLLKNERKK